MGRRCCAIFVTVTCLLVTACTSGSPSSSGTRGGSPAAQAVARTGAVAIESNQDPVITAAKLTADQATSLGKDWPTDLTLHAGLPVQVTLDGSIPTGGIKLTRTYKSALPDGVTATLAYYNEQLGTWLAVPSTLSEDRKSVTAVVHHLSLWTDVVGVVGPVTQGISSAVTSAADWAYYQVGKVFDTRVDPPTCSGKPEWLDSSAFIATDRNNPLLFCVGSDPKHRSVLDVKARVNRGFAYTAYLNVTPSWTYNSTFDNHSLSDAVSTIGHLDQALSDTWAAFSPKGAVLVGPGKSSASVSASRGFAQPAPRRCCTWSRHPPCRSWCRSLDS